MLSAENFSRAVSIAAETILLPRPCRRFLVRAALLDDEHRYAQFVYLEQLPSGELIKLFHYKFHFSEAL